MKIWIYLNGAQQGPYTLEQLAHLPVTASTPVWYEGLEKWTPAGHAPATAAIFCAPAADQAVAPMPESAPMPGSVADPFVRKPPTYIGWSILLTFLCCSPIAILAIVTGAISSSRFNAGDLKGARRMSNLTEWLIIFTIVLGFMTIPLGMISFI